MLALGFEVRIRDAHLTSKSIRSSWFDATLLLLLLLQTPDAAAIALAESTGMCLVVRRVVCVSEAHSECCRLGVLVLCLCCSLDAPKRPARVKLRGGSQERATTCYEWHIVSLNVLDNRRYCLSFDARSINRSIDR